MNTLDLHAAVSTDGDAGGNRDRTDGLKLFTNFPEFEIVTAVNFGQGQDEIRTPIDTIIWDHDKRQLVLVQEEPGE